MPINKVQSSNFHWECQLPVCLQREMNKTQRQVKSSFKLHKQLLHSNRTWKRVSPNFICYRQEPLGHMSKTEKLSVLIFDSQPKTTQNFLCLRHKQNIFKIKILAENKVWQVNINIVIKIGIKMCTLQKNEFFTSKSSFEKSTSQRKMLKSR